VPAVEPQAFFLLQVLRLLCCRLAALGAVFRARLLTVFDALRIERAAHHVVTHARQIFYATATDQNYAVLLQVMAFTADVRDDLETVGETYLGDFTQRRVRFFRRRVSDPDSSGGDSPVSGMK